MSLRIDRKAVGVWYDDYSYIISFKGTTFHNLINSKNGSKYLNLEETVFAMLKTDLLLVDYKSGRSLNLSDFFEKLNDNYNITNLMRIHAYLTFQKIGKNPTSLRSPRIDYGQTVDSVVVKDVNAKERDKVVESCDLLRHFKNYYEDDLIMMREVPLDTDPLYKVEDTNVYLTVPDSSVLELMENIETESAIIAITNLDSTYLIRLTNF